jgi:hypothetical protein
MTPKDQKNVTTLTYLRYEKTHAFYKLNLSDKFGWIFLDIYVNHGGLLIDEQCDFTQRTEERLRRFSINRATLTFLLSMQHDRKHITSNSNEIYLLQLKPIFLSF